MRSRWISRRSDLIRLDSGSLEEVVRIGEVVTILILISCPVTIVQRSGGVTMCMQASRHLGYCTSCRPRVQSVPAICFHSVMDRLQVSSEAAGRLDMAIGRQMNHIGLGRLLSQDGV